MDNRERGPAAVIVNRDILKNHLVSFVNMIQGISSAKAYGKLEGLKQEIIDYIVDKDVDIIFSELKIDGGAVVRRPAENIREYRLRKLRENGKTINPGTGRYEDDTGKYSSDYPIQITDNGDILDLDNVMYDPITTLIDSRLKVTPNGRRIIPKPMAKEEIKDRKKQTITDKSGKIRHRNEKGKRVFKKDFKDINLFENGEIKLEKFVERKQASARLAETKNKRIRKNKK
jgi:hypothetical protein